MHLRSGGLDLFYIDESHDNKHYVVSAVRIPFLRQEAGIWQIAWPSFLEAAKRWRAELRRQTHIPRNKELHGVKLASTRGRYLHGKHNFKYKQARDAYDCALSNLLFLPDGSVFAAVASRNNHLYGKQRLEASMLALFQRMRRMCVAENTNAIAFFDQGHPEYRRLYRAAQVYLPTGSAIGGWAQGRSTLNMPLDMFTKDANEKNSKHCYFTQVADLVAYAAFLKIKMENGELTPWQEHHQFARLWDAIPSTKINSQVTRTAPRDGIVRL